MKLKIAKADAAAFTDAQTCCVHALLLGVDADIKGSTRYPLTSTLVIDIQARRDTIVIDELLKPIEHLIFTKTETS